MVGVPNYMQLNGGRPYEAREAWQFSHRFNTTMARPHTARPARRRADATDKSEARRAQHRREAADLHTAHCVKQRYEQDKELPPSFDVVWSIRPDHARRPALDEESLFMSCGSRTKAMWRTGKVVATYAVAPGIVTKKAHERKKKAKKDHPEHLNPKRFLFIQSRREMFCVPEEMAFAR
jgi:hypothetical protein